MKRFIAVLVLWILLPLALLAAPQQGHAQEPGASRCFETGYCIHGAILRYWEQQNGLVNFGLPITEQRQEVIEGRPVEVQWFERQRLEIHPQHAPPFDVLPGRLGAEVLKQEGRVWRDLEPTGELPGCRYFHETNQSVCGDILVFWQTHGLEIDGVPGISDGESLALFGLPLSGQTTEILRDGQAREVQWFERARLEIHRENASPFRVLPGFLGREYLQQPEPVQPGYRLVFVSDRDGNPDIFTMRADGSGLRNLTNHPAADNDPRLSPDGTRIAFVSNREGNEDIYLMHVNGTGLTRLTHHPEDDENPTWAPDGKSIAFMSWRDGNPEIYMQDVDDGPRFARLTFNPADDIQPSWSPDGTRIAFASNRNGNFDIYVMNRNGSSAENLTNHPDTDGRPAWSPNSAYIAFETNRDGNWEIYAMYVTGKSEVNLTTNPANDAYPAWSPDGLHLSFHTNRQGFFQVYTMNRSGSFPTDMTSSPSTNWFADW